MYAVLAAALVAACSGGGGEPMDEPYWKCQVLAHWPHHEWENAACAVYSESGWRRGAHNTGNTDGSDDLGIWQINEQHTEAGAEHYIERGARGDWRAASGWAREYWEWWRRYLGDTGWEPWYGWRKHCRGIV